MLVSELTISFRLNEVLMFEKTSYNNSNNTSCEVHTVYVRTASCLANDLAALPHN